MQTRTWGIVALVLLTLAGVVFGTMIGPMLSPAPDEPTDAPAAAVSPDAPAASTPDPVDPAPTEVAPADEPTPPDDGTATEGSPPEPADDLMPEHITREDFDQVLDAVNDECGLAGWSEMDRSCTSARCSALLAQPVEQDGTYPSPGQVIQCAAWTTAWGPSADTTSEEVTCEDGVRLHVALVSPVTKRLQRQAEAGEAAPFPADRAEISQRACERWAR